MGHKESRDYLDYNATSPLADSVKEFLAKGDLPFANPASIHSSGKQARSQIKQVTSFIKQIFALPDHHVIFHSGATEGINTVFLGLTEQDALVHSSVDHPCVIESAKRCAERGVWVESFTVDSHGNFDLEQLVQTLSTLATSKRRVLLNYTYGNNETGVIWPLDWALACKVQTGCQVHVDAVQVVGKIPDLKLVPELDFYTFSAHKFGALKSVGFTLLKDLNSYPALMLGGLQQEGHRAGTENPLGIQSVQLALAQASNAPVEEVAKFRDEIEELFTQILADQGMIVAKNCKAGRLANTSLLLFKNHKADFLLVGFDLNGLDVSMGAACSSQSLKVSHVLAGMGIEYDQNAIRISIGPESLKRKEQILQKLQKVFNQFN